MRRFFRNTSFFILLLSLSFRVFGITVEDAEPSPVSEKKELVLSFTGDMMAHIINYSMPDYSMIYRDIEHIMLNDSLTFCNVEFPVNPSLPQASYPVFNIHPEYVEAAVDAGVDVLSIANNHSGDQGTEGLIKTVEAMESISSRYLHESDRKIYFSGAKRNPDTEFRPETIYKDGWKIGYLSVSQFSNVKPEDGHMLLVDFRNNRQSDDFIDWIKQFTDDFDLFVLSYHGGVEYYTEPVKQKKELFYRLAEAGVDVIWGHHPHVVQPVEVVDTGEKSAVIMNSLGNFISGQGRIADPDLPEEEWSYTGDSAIIQTVFVYDSGTPVLKDVNAIPTANIMTTNREVVITPLKELTHQAVPEPWMSFFLERFILMHDYFTRNIQYFSLPLNQE